VSELKLTKIEYCSSLMDHTIKVKEIQSKKDTEICEGTMCSFPFPLLDLIEVGITTFIYTIMASFYQSYERINEETNFMKKLGQSLQTVWSHLFFLSHSSHFI
jgi:hypothetical protein